jgi:periplasmic divalent cation tolerance protein
MTSHIVIFVTCGSAAEARKLARALVEGRLAACVNILQAPVESIYRWKGSVDSAKEYLLVIKSTRRRFAALQAEIKRLHSYDIPEIIALPIDAGSPDYLAWLTASVSVSKKTKPANSKSRKARSGKSRPHKPSGYSRLMVVPRA